MVDDRPLKEGRRAEEGSLGSPRLSPPETATMGKARLPSQADAPVGRGRKLTRSVRLWPAKHRWC
eukprot:12181509-Alexandrium_andersonii.AAC.1